MTRTRIAIVPVLLLCSCGDLSRNYRLEPFIAAGVAETETDMPHDPSWRSDSSGSTLWFGARLVSKETYVHLSPESVALLGARTLPPARSSFEADEKATAAAKDSAAGKEPNAAKLIDKGAGAAKSLGLTGWILGSVLMVAMVIVGALIFRGKLRGLPFTGGKGATTDG